MKIALVQFEVKLNQSLNKTLTRAARLTKIAKRKSCHLICFPEDFLFGPFDYYPKKAIPQILRQENKITHFFSNLAKQTGISIIAGTLLREEHGKLFNTCFVFNQQGRLVYVHNKQKLVPLGFEGKNISPGKNKIKPFILNGIKCAVLICRELFYPNLFQKLRKQGAEVVFVPAFWSKRSSYYQKNKLKNKYQFLTEMKVVDALCQARSFENEICLCFVNACGKIKQKFDFDVLLGRTQVCYPFFGCTQKLNLNREGIIIFKYQKSVIEDARKAYRVFSQLKPRQASLFSFEK